MVVLLCLLFKRFTSCHVTLGTTQQHPDQSGSPEEMTSPEEVTSLTSSRSTPPRLLICYSSRDGPAHVRAVMHLGAFLQQHMATQVQESGRVCVCVCLFVGVSESVCVCVFVGVSESVCVCVCWRE